MKHPNPVLTVHANKHLYCEGFELATSCSIDKNSVHCAKLVVKISSNFFRRVIFLTNPMTNLCD
jgi:hypothetical protein